MPILYRSPVVSILWLEFERNLLVVLLYRQHCVVKREVIMILHVRWNEPCSDMEKWREIGRTMSLL